MRLYVVVEGEKAIGTDDTDKAFDLLVTKIITEKKVAFLLTESEYEGYLCNRAEAETEEYFDNHFRL